MKSNLTSAKVQKKSDFIYSIDGIL